jgi:predicted nucleic acid-binding protein
MLHSGGKPEAVFNLVIHGNLRCFVSDPIFAEYEEVLRRPRLAIDPEKIAVALTPCGQFIHTSALSL